MTRHTEKREAKAGLTQGRAARLLGVTREHLNRVLNGHRTSKRLTARYNSLVASDKSGPELPGIPLPPG